MTEPAARLTGLDVMKSPLMPAGQAFIVAPRQLIVGPPPLSREVWEAFHRGAMLDWYAFIGEGPSSPRHLLFGYGQGTVNP